MIHWRKHCKGCAILKICYFKNIKEVEKYKNERIFYEYRINETQMLKETEVKTSTLGAVGTVDCERDGKHADTSFGPKYKGTGTAFLHFWRHLQPDFGARNQIPAHRPSCQIMNRTQLWIMTFHSVSAEFRPEITDEEGLMSFSAAHHQVAIETS